MSDSFKGVRENCLITLIVTPSLIAQLVKNLPVIEET